MTKFEVAYHQLVSAWVEHDDLRRSGAPLHELAAAGDRLRTARVNVRSHLRNTV